MTLGETLLEMSGKPFAESGIYYNVYLPPIGAWVSGMPYETSQFCERAYAFGCREDAERIGREYFADKKPEVIRRDG